MLAWLKKFFGSNDPSQVKSFDAESGQLNIRDYQKAGKASIKTGKIVGSVGRAHELDAEFRYRGRDLTDRYHSMNQANRDGRPSAPIKVIKVKRDRSESEYYVMDGHHRVAQAKKQGYDEMNAEVTEAIIEEERTEQTDQTGDNADSNAAE